MTSALAAHTTAPLARDDDPPEGAIEAARPAHTTANDLDVGIAGLSLMCLVDWSGTPCVHNAEAEGALHHSPEPEDIAPVVVSSGTEGSSKFSVDRLPAGFAAGDLLAFPCAGPTTLHDVRAG